MSMHEGRRERRLLLASYVSTFELDVRAPLACHDLSCKLEQNLLHRSVELDDLPTEVFRNLRDDENKTNDTFRLCSRLRSKPR